MLDFFLPITGARPVTKVPASTSPSGPALKELQYGETKSLPLGSHSALAAHRSRLLADRGREGAGRGALWLAPPGLVLGPSRQRPPDRHRLRRRRRGVRPRMAALARRRAGRARVALAVAPAFPGSLSQTGATALPPSKLPYEAALSSLELGKRVSRRTATRRRLDITGSLEIASSLRSPWTAEDDPPEKGEPKHHTLIENQRTSTDPSARALLRAGAAPSRPSSRPAP